MSQSPDEPSSAADAYVRGWAAINKLMRRGLSWSGHERNCAYLNLRDGRFVDVSAVSGFDFPDDGRALATIDWDHDGDVDVLVTNRSAPRLRFLENRQSTGNGFVALRPVDASGSDAIGASVEVELADGRTLVRGLRAGEGYLAQSSSWLTIGLGQAPLAGVRVRWPGGESESFSGVERDGRYVLTRGKGVAARRPVPASRPLAGIPETVQRFRAEERRRASALAEGRLVLAAPVPVPELALRSSDGQRVALFGIEAGGLPRGTGRPVLLNVWASWCAPCVAELAEFQQRSAELDASGLALLALSVDEDPAAAAELLSGLSWSRPWAEALPATIELLDALQGILRDSEERLALPTSFLFDAQGYLRIVYFGRLDPDRLLADLELLQLPSGRARDLATPLRGIWHARSLETDLAFFESRLQARGLPGAASEYARGRIEVRQTSRAQLLADFARRSAAQGRLDEAISTLRQAIELDPGLFQAHFDLAVILHREERLTEAISAYLQVLALVPEYEEARFNLGLAYLAAGDLAAARVQLVALEQSGSRLAATLEREIDRR